MKKVFMLSACTILIYGAFVLFSSFMPSKNTTVTPAPSSGLAMCFQAKQPAIPDAMLFDPSIYAAPPVMTRKSIYAFSSAEFTSLKNGIAAMKALPTSDPTSWTYQAAIHGTTMGGAMPSWNSCTHNSVFFLSWHRMYLYFFERILRAKSGNPNFTLPYWDYQANPALHVEYRTSGSTLFHARNASINSGGALPPGISPSIDNALNQVPFNNFQSLLEGVHGSVHGAIGGDMGSVPTAAKDPVFWLHHCNIDRLWEKWIKKCGGRLNPSDAAWLNQTYTFFDETGTAVNMTGTQVVNTAASLNYKYDLPISIACIKLNKDLLKLVKYRVFRIPDPGPLKTTAFRANFRNAKELEGAQEARNLKLQFGEIDQADRVIIEFPSPKLGRHPEGAIEVYVNLGTAKPNPKLKNFAGVLDLFSLSGHRQKDQKNAETARMDISMAIANLKLGAKDLRNIDLTFVTRGNSLNGKEITTLTDFASDGMDMVIERLQK